MESAVLDDLRAGIRKKERKRTRKNNPFDELSDKLNSLGPAGVVTTILVHDTVRKAINSYGLHLNDGRVWNRIHLGIGDRAFASIIRYREIASLYSYHRGRFVPATEFWGQEGDYVALVNIPWNPGPDDSIPYVL